MESRRNESRRAKTQLEENGIYENLELCYKCEFIISPTWGEMKSFASSGRKSVSLYKCGSEGITP